MQFQVDGTIWTQLDERSRREFDRLAERCDSQSIARLALLIAQGEYPDIVIDAVLEKIGKVATTVISNLPSDATDAEKIQALNIQLFEIMNFWGDPSELYDAKSCYLNDVFSRRSGLPVTLAMLYAELADQLALHMTVVSLPGHFLLRYQGSGDDGEIFVDPFNRGAIRDRAQCRELLRHFTRGRMPWSDEYLRAVANRSLLTYHLYDLKGAYARVADNGRLLRVLNYLLTLHTDDPRIHRERGMLLAKLDRNAQAAGDLATYLMLAPDAPDRTTIESTITALKKMNGPQ